MSAHGQQALRITSIEARSHYSAAFPLRYCNVLLYDRDGVDKTKIRAVIQELRKSGLFKSLRWQLIRNKPQSDYKLILYPKYKVDFEKIVIVDVIVSDFEPIDKAKFVKQLSLNGLSIGKSLWAETPFGEIARSVRKALDDTLQRRPFIDEIQVPWISVRVTTKGRVSLTVHGPEYSPELTIFGPW
ncbi:MAG: hypothetical protein IPJ30_10595 [Acidobacteria bacterium]|nr:hypothetical protein [Acidobacteriota bacterium]